jgi:hypothetical protein
MIKRLTQSAISSTGRLGTYHNILNSCCHVHLATVNGGSD